MLLEYKYKSCIEIIKKRLFIKRYFNFHVSISLITNNIIQKIHALVTFFKYLCKFALNHGSHDWVQGGIVDVDFGFASAPTVIVTPVHLPSKTNYD